MNMQKPLRFTAAIISAVLACSGTAGIISAETAPTETETQAATASIAEAQQETASDSAKNEWWKAEITDYDSSLSLISYETTPEIVQTTTEPSTESATAAETKTSEATTATEPASAASTENSNASNIPDEAVKSAQTADPIPVDMVSGGAPVGEIPDAQQVPVIEAQSGEFAFTTYGWGHGVGMSQNGANYYAMYSGWSYQDILFHYYPGTYLMNTGTAETEQVTVNGVSGDVLSQVAGIVEREVGPSMATETIKAQAVAVYTYIKYYGDDARDLRCNPNPSQTVIDACASVLGEALYYDGNFALTMFCASSGGNTANCYDVFSNDIPYLRSVPSDYDASCDPHYGNITYMTSAEVKNIIESSYGITLSDNPVSWFQVVPGDSGYTAEVVIDNQITVRGNDFQNCLGLKSPKFDIYFAL